MRKIYKHQSLFYTKIVNAIEKYGLEIDNEYIIKNDIGHFQIFRKCILRQDENVRVFMNEDGRLKQSFGFDEEYSKKLREIILLKHDETRSEEIENENKEIEEYLNKL